MSSNREPEGRGPSEIDIGEEAAEWLIRLADEEIDSGEPYPSRIARNHAFMQWIGQSSNHLRAYLETYETHRRLHGIDAAHAVDVDSLIANRSADVIRLYRGPDDTNGVSRSVSDVPADSLSRIRTDRDGSGARWVTSRLFLTGALAATLSGLVVGAALLWHSFGSQPYVTGIGEQRTAKLEDGSFVTLNTNSQLEVDFHAQTRLVKLIRGEAFFVVEHDSTRPFVVQSGTAAVRAVGTEFSVRQRVGSTDVSVLEGVVQVTASNTNSPAYQGSTSEGTVSNPIRTVAPLRLNAGEEAKVTEGRVAKRLDASVEDSLAWRRRRLIFHDACLSDIADEFNRYNRTQMIVTGSARDKRFSGIFDADRPQSLMLYAAEDDSLVVQPERNSWVIRSR